MTELTKKQLITRAKMRLAMVAGFPESQLAQMDKCLAEIALERLMAPVEPVVPDGYALVPIEPTMAVLDEFDSIIDHGAEDSKDAWSRLLAAAAQQEVNP
ncbi:hypothetical protein [Leclercia sp. W17]|uniref:hypothetical protein n=1 Tax=Leclercia sp. W17 TaxID=2282309 RepID=UPI000DF1FC5E|nr:hypothetical protein [Leclercia sp. W17]AXF64448.1 hypothetical protein DVA44_10160 [Leclercia sp. W17]